MAGKTGSKHEIINGYIPFVNFLGAFLGENCEVVLHDTNNKEKSVLAIANDHISGRRIGAPLTDLALKFVINKVYEQQDWVMGYTTRSHDGRVLHSATYFIKDGAGKLVGMICMNMDTSDILAARDILNRFISSAGFEKTQKKELFATSTPADISENSEPVEHFETFPHSMEDLTETLISKVVEDAKILPERMTSDEKLAVVSTLNDHGVFMLKGTIRVVAKHLAVSEATMYRYLQKINVK